jgi:hypothetical protein
MKSVNVPHGREVALVGLIALVLSFLGCEGRTNSGVPKLPSGAAPTPAYPLKLSANRRYLLDQNEFPS